jgi:hypothetical protein
MKSICVYSSSSDEVSPVFFDAASELGRLIALGGKSFVYGGGCLGLMGAAARSVHEHGGRVIGVIPGFMRLPGICYEEADELVVASDMRERKALMESMADAFIGLPGGFGTLEEMLEIITLKQLGLHSKPIVFLNTEDFYNPLLETFEHMYRGRFAREEYRALYYFAPGPDDAMDYIESYQPPCLETKWFDPISLDE